MSTIIYPIYTLMTHREFEWLWNIDKSEEKILEERNRKENKEEIEKLRDKLEIEYNEDDKASNKKTFEVKIRGNSYKYSCVHFEGVEVIELEDFPGKKAEKIEIKLLRYGIGYVKFEIESIIDPKELKRQDFNRIKEISNEIKKVVWTVVEDIKYNVVYKKDEDEVFEEEREALTGITFPLMRDKDFEEFYIYAENDKTYLFSWDKIQGNDNKKLKDFLIKKFGINWVETANFKKTDNKTTITVSTKKNHLTLKLNDKKTDVSLKIDDGRTDKFSAKIENNDINIYKNNLKIFKYGDRDINNEGDEEIKPEENILEDNIDIKDKDTVAICILHHGYLLCSKKVNKLIIYSNIVWYQTKTYVDIRRGEYRPVMAYVRGLVNSIDLLKEMFHEIIGINIKIRDKIENTTKEKFDYLREVVDRRIFCLDRGVGAISDYSEENISIKITDDMRATQRALETLEPGILTLGIIVFLDIVYKNMFSETITLPNPGIYDIAIITLSTLLSMFWISLNVVGYVRSFWISVGAFKDPDDVLRDTFLLIFSIGIIILTMLTIGNQFELENPAMYVSLFSGILIVVFFLFMLMSKKKIEWSWMVFISLLSCVSVLFLKPEGILYALFLFYIVFMLWLFFGWFIKKIGAHMSEGRETELWKEFKKERREKFREKIENNEDPYKDWYFGEVFEKFIREFKKEKSEYTQRKIIKNVGILLQALAVTFTIGYLIQHEIFMLFISAIASLLTTSIEFQYYLHLKEDKDKKTKIKQFMPQYAMFALAFSVIADLHLIPAMFFNAQQQFAIPLAFGALIANAIALVMVIYTMITKSENGSAETA